MLTCGLRTRFLAAACSLVFALFLAAPAFGQGVAYTAPADLDQLVQSAQTIVRGRVTSARVEPHPQFPNLQTIVVTLTVTKLLKGQAGPTYTFRQFLWDARDEKVLATYKKAGEVLLFLNPVSTYGLTSPVGLEQGRFRVLRDAKGNSYVLNGRGNVGLFDQVAAKATTRGVGLSSRVREMLSKPAGPASLDAFEEAIQSLAGAPN
jgi:hypothetical protein